MYDFTSRAHAVRRYPDEDPEFAVYLFTHDRRGADLGALGRRPQSRPYDPRQGLRIERRKSREVSTREVFWHLSVFGRFYEEGRAMPSRSKSSPIAYTMRLIDVNLTITVSAGAQELCEQRGRDAVAERLRQARAELRQAVERKLSGQRS